MIIILMGVSCCGKTTIGRELEKRFENFEFTFYDGDDFHSEENKSKMISGVALTDDDRHPWLKKLTDLIQINEASGKNIVLACSALKRQYRAILKSAVTSTSNLIFVHLQINKEQAHQRILQRKGHFFSKNLVDNQFNALEEIHEDESLKYWNIDCTNDIDTICKEIFDEIANYLPNVTLTSDDK